MIRLSLNQYRRNNMIPNQQFKITFTKLNGESTTRHGKWTYKCKEFVANAGHKCFLFWDTLRDRYTTATDKITPWNIK
jgi:hypothetical protein